MSKIELQKKEVEDSKGNIKGIGKTYNEYGGITVKQEGGKFYWAVEDWDRYRWEEISEHLFNALNKFEDERIANTKTAH